MTRYLPYQRSTAYHIANSNSVVLTCSVTSYTLLNLESSNNSPPPHKLSKREKLQAKINKQKKRTHTLYNRVRERGREGEKERGREEEKLSS